MKNVIVGFIVPFGEILNNQKLELIYDLSYINNNCEFIINKEKTLLIYKLTKNNIP